MQLNFGRDSDVNQQCFATAAVSLDACNKATSVHEFGHILGMAHEQNRPDDISNSGCHKNDPNPYTLYFEDFTTYGNTLFTGYDPDSIMNYCRPKYGTRIDLSPTDKLAAKVYYGRVPTFTLETSVLKVPVIQVNGQQKKVSFKYNSSSNTFLLTSISPTSLNSSVNSTFVGSTMNLPIVSYIEGGHVTSVYHATFKYLGGNKFKLTHMPLHSESLR